MRLRYCLSLAGKLLICLIAFQLVISPLASAQSPQTPQLPQSVLAASRSENSLSIRQTPAQNLSPGAEEIANVIGVTPLLNQLAQLPAEEQGRSGKPMSLQVLTVRQKITELVITSSLEVDGVLAEIDDEIAQSNELRAALESKRDRKLAINNVANFVSGGALAAVSSSLSFKESTANWANVAGILSGVVPIILSTIGIRQQRGDKGKLVMAPNMLAKLFDLAPEFHSDYPPNVWQYLNNPTPTEPTAGTRKELLIKQWIEVGRIDPPDNAKSKQKIELLTSGVSQQRGLSIDVLNDRAAMLADLRARVSLMKRDLSKLMIALRVQ